MSSEHTSAPIVVYGSSWCGYTVRVLKWLERSGADYRYVDVDDSPEDEERIAKWNHGRSIRPTLAIGDDVFVNPDLFRLEEELKARNLL